MQMPHESTEQTGSCCDWRKTVEDFETRAQDYVRTEPVKAVGAAFIAGVILTILPVGRVIAVLVRLALMLVRPLLLVLGAVKLCEELDKRNHR
jgi:hypothetical protein